MPVFVRTPSEGVWGNTQRKKHGSVINNMASNLKTNQIRSLYFKQQAIGASSTSQGSFCLMNLLIFVHYKKGTHDLCKERTRVET